MTATIIGLNVAPSAAPGSDPVALARRAESAGFDFVSCFDHPGSADPVFESWTLLTWIAASTERVKIATRVLAVPLRRPAMLAKSAESLSRLSGGRLILGLGAGGNDQELVSFGAPPLGASEKIGALEEAVTIIQALWSQPATSYEGRHSRVDGARLEPKPAGPIPIWLGTFGGRALDLTGRVADGWIPSLGYVPDDRLVAMRARVLASAERAGRDPAAVTCALQVAVEVSERPRSGEEVLTGPAHHIAEVLSGWKAAGFSAFNLSPTGERQEAQVDALAGEVLPALRH